MSDDFARIQRFMARPGDSGFGSGREYLLVDVFTDTPLSGNQLAVFMDGTGFSGELMQAVARELNLSETVFMLPSGGRADAAVRIFTPSVELPFAGHPILGSAIVAAWALEREEIRLLAGIGEVRLDVQRGADWVASARMQQPIPSWEYFGPQQELLAALGVTSSRLPIEVYTNGPRHVLVELESEAAVAALAPDSGALAALGAFGVSCFAGSERSWKTRMFAPGLGVSEDPATGSAAGPLALHLARHGRTQFGQEIEIHQGEEIGRSSLLLARAVGSSEQVERVEVAGSAVLAGTGLLRAR